MRALPIALALLAASVPLSARPGVAIESAVFVERDKASAQGLRRVVEPAEALRSGDRVVTVLRWDAPRGSFTVTSPIPRTLSFEGSSIDTLEVSTDGGRSWQPFGSEVAPEAVTHLRWRVGNGSGRLTYSAIVR